MVLCLLAAAGAVSAQETPSLPALRRVLLLPPPPPSAETQSWIAAQRVAESQEPHRGGLFGLFKGKRPAAASPQTETNAIKGSHGKPVPPPEATPEQLQAWCETCLYTDLSLRLRTKQHLTLPTEAEVQTALSSLQFSPASLHEEAALRRLGRALDCDAVLTPTLTHIEQNEGARRSITMRGTLRCLVLASGERTALPTGGKRRKQSLPALAGDFPFFGTESAGHIAFQNGYTRTAVQLAAEAARQAAAVMTHTLRTGEITPFARAEERIALLPVPAPPVADALLFTPDGRRVAKAAVRDLPQDLADQFQPDVEPFRGKEVVPVERARAELKEERITTEALWRQDQPEAARVQTLGARLDVSYVLMAHITAAELQTGTPEPGQTFATREARAEAVGALVRVSDGMVLWQDHTSATLTLHPTARDRPQSIDKTAVLQAEHYALTALQRRFREYRDHFEN